MAPAPDLRRIEGTGERAGAPRPALGPALELAGLGTGLTLAVALMGRLPGGRSDLGPLQALFLVAAAFYALAVSRLRRWRRLPFGGLAALVVALAARLALLPAPPALSDDVYRYVWEGRVLVHGGNPWRQAPLDPALAPLRDRRVFPHVNHPGLATLYPPLAEAGYALVAALSPTVGAMKLWITLHDLALCAALAALLRRRGAPAVAVLVYAWNPLVLLEYAGNGHNEPTALLGLVLALLWARRRPALSALALAAATLVKLAPLAALPFLWREWNARARVLAAVTLALGLGAFVLLTRMPDSGLRAYWSSWRNNALVFDLLERATGSFAIARALAIAGVLAVAVALLWRRVPGARATRAVFRTGFLLGPVAHPWYLGWPLVLEPLAPSAPWLLLSVTAILAYGLFRAPPEGGGYHLPLAGRFVEYGVPAALGIALAWQRRRGRGGAAHGAGPAPVPGSGEERT